MLSNMARDTEPELAVRRALHARGYRYRVDMRPSTEIRSRADIVFTRQKIAVFIDGCFWHRCPTHATTPKTNSGYWLPKLKRNAERDLEVTESLRSLGWTVLRFWEHELPREVVEQVEAAWFAQAAKSPITLHHRVTLAAGLRSPAPPRA